MSILIAIDGVLRDGYGERLHAGVKLYHALAATYRVVLASNDLEAVDERWCKLQGINNYAEMLDKTCAWPDVPLRLRQLEKLRADGGRIELAVEADPELAPLILSAGVPVVLFATPRPAKPKFAIRQWDGITSEIARHREMEAGLVEPELDKWE
jgi:hypothetical protein